MVMVNGYNASNIVISLDNGILIEIHFVNIMTLFLLTKQYPIKYIFLPL